MQITSNNGVIKEIKANTLEFNKFVEAGKWSPNSKVLFLRQKDGYVMCDVLLQTGVTINVKVIISSYFVNK